MRTRIFPVVLSVACAVVLSACGDDEAGGPHRNVHLGRDPTDPGSGAFGAGGGSLFSTAPQAPQAQGSEIGVNAYLWRGALETLKFMPLSSADPFGGVIITDWWTPASSSNERFKATAYILGRQLRADAIRISLFRQVMQNGQWVDAPVDAGKPTELENMVLARARDLRAQSAAGQ